MTCCNTTVKELLNDCCGGDCAETPGCKPIFDIASPIEGQTLVYSEEFQAFINQTPASSILFGIVNPQVGDILKYDPSTSSWNNYPLIIPQYSLPIASSSVLGGIKLGDSLAIQLDGTLSVVHRYAPPVVKNRDMSNNIATTLDYLNSHNRISVQGSYSVQISNIGNVGDEIYFEQVGTTLMTIVDEPGVTYLTCPTSQATIKPRANGSVICAKCVEIDGAISKWTIMGDFIV